MRKDYVAIRIWYPRLLNPHKMAGVVSYDTGLEAEIKNVLQGCGLATHTSCWAADNQGWYTIVNAPKSMHTKVARAIQISFQDAVKVS